MTDQNVTVDEEKKDSTEELVPVTQVTSVAQEEEKTGQKLELPPPEVIANNAMHGYIHAIQELRKKLTDKSISKISVAKGVLSGLDLPEDGLPVYLKTSQEKEIFALVQQAVNCRYLVTQYHIDMKRKEMLNKAQTTSTTEQPQGEANV